MANGFIGTISSKTYHRPSCFNISKAASNQIKFNNRTEAIAAGYKPCGMCKSDKGGNDNMAKTNNKETGTNTIILLNRTALWRDCNTGGGWTGERLDAGEYKYDAIKNGFTRIPGKGWVHCEPVEPEVVDEVLDDGLNEKDVDAVWKSLGEDIDDTF